MIPHLFQFTLSSYFTSSLRTAYGGVAISDTRGLLRHFIPRNDDSCHFRKIEVPICDAGFVVKEVQG
jgi:hypothetical protein